MNSDAENFEALRKLLALKRHEQPPPGYFPRLPDKIVLRIERGDAQLNFWERFVAGYSFRPAFAYSFALAAFGALAFSVVNSVRTADDSAPQLAGIGWPAAASREALAGQFYPSDSLYVANWRMGSTNPSAAAPALPSLFGPPDHSRAVPVSYQAGPP
jgi:hypothetical protein